MAQLNFDATQVEPDAGFDVVPVGWYNVMADESDLKPTKDGAGTYLQIRFNILDGQYKGRKLFARLNIRNANAQTQEIALRQLSAIGHAVGVLHIVDSQQLHGLPLKVKVKIRPAEGQYDEQNDIISYKNINEPVTTVGSAPASAQPPAPVGFGAPPPQAPPPQAPPAFAQPPAFSAPAPVHNPIAAAEADGWVVHPQAPGHHYKGQEVVTNADLGARYPAPVVAPPPPAQPPAAQPWAQPPMAAAPPPVQPPAAMPPQAPPPTQGAPWTQPPAPPVGQQPPADPNAAAAAAAQQAPPPWANQGAPAA